MKSLAIFVESIRWLGVRWGLGPFSRGLARAGIEAEVSYWRWHAAWRGWTVLPAIMDHAMLQREAQRLADHITAARRGSGMGSLPVRVSPVSSVSSSDQKQQQDRGGTPLTLMGKMPTPHAGKMSASQSDRGGTPLAHMGKMPMPHTPAHAVPQLGPIILAGYSCGAYVALRAIELLPEGVQIDAAVFFAGAFAPSHDMTRALSRVRGNIVNCSSKLDCVIVGLGTCLFGTGERTFGPSAGMVGLTHPSSHDPRVVDIRWEPGMAALGNFGDHFTAAAERFVADRVAPWLR